MSSISAGDCSGVNIELVSAECVDGGYSSGTVRHASLKARIRKFKIRCAGSVEVEETYSMLVLDKGRGSAVLEVLALPRSFSRNTEGKCVRKSAIASSTRPDNIWDRISNKYQLTFIMHTNRGIIGTLTKRNLFHVVFKLIRGAIAWIIGIECLDDFVAIGIKVSDCAVLGECYSCAGITTIAEIVEHQRTLKELLTKNIYLKGPLNIQVDMELGLEKEKLGWSSVPEIPFGPKVCSGSSHRGLES